MAMVVNISRLKCLLAFLVLAWFTAYGKRHPTSTCPGKASLTTGRLFNQPDTLHVVPSKGKLSIPGMVYIEGGGMLMGSGKPITVNSFYMDQAPITNLDYREYLYDLKKTGLQQEYEAAIPHKEVWKEYASCYNDPYVTYMDSSEDHYLYSSTFMYYPVVAVTWEQAMAYCKWRTQKFKETVIKRQKKQKPAPSNGIDDPNKEQAHVEENESEGNSYPVFRLPTEAEWEYAARGIVGVAGIDYLQRHQRNYPWSGSSPRGKDGRFLANFKRGKGNYRGMAGESNHAAPTTYIYHYPPNELGLYDMVGNVCCWVSDTYTPLFLQDTGDLNPVMRGESLNTNGEHPNDGAKVYKGCSWADCAYFLQIGTRRYLNKDRATPTIGFRCVVSSVD